MRTLTVTLTLTLALVGCSNKTAEDTDLYGCEIASTTAIDDLSETGDGFTQSAQAALDAISGARDGTITLTAGGTQAITITITPDGTAELLDRVEQSGDTDLLLDADDSVECEDAYRFPATLTIESGTALDETATGAVLVSASGEGTWSVEIEMDDVQGDAVPGGFDPAEMTSSSMRVGGSGSGATWSGYVSFLGETVDDSGPNGVATATIEEWGQFEVGEDVGDTDTDTDVDTDTDTDTDVDTDTDTDTDTDA